MTAPGISDATNRIRRGPHRYCTLYRLTIQFSESTTVSWMMDTESGMCSEGSLKKSANEARISCTTPGAGRACLSLRFLANGAIVAGPR